MRIRRPPWILALFLVLAGLTASTLACSSEPALPRAWIDMPLTGSSVPVGTPAPVIAHAYAREGVAELLLSVNGQAYRRSPPDKPGEASSDAVLEWLPEKEGDHVLQIVAYSKTGQASNPVMVSVKAIGKATPTPPPTVDRVPISPVAVPDLAIVDVQAVVAGYKGAAGDVPFCNTRVTYRNAGTAAVPRDYVIQFLFNGTPQWANTTAGGLAPGASAEATFVYQFVGSATLGIQLDSTSLIAESDETNNAFSDMRLCGGTPPPVTVTPTATATPTRITPPPLVPACRGLPVIASFSASPDKIQAGHSSTLSWGAVANADSVSLSPGIGDVATPGTTTVSPASITTYTLTARCGSSTTTRQVTIQVTGAPPPIPSTFTPTPTRTRTLTRTPTRDTTRPAIPNPLDPTGGEAIACTGTTGSATLKWSSVGDPSGVTYYVKWEGAGASGGWEGASTQHGISVKCGYGYSWRVRACDGAGNCSDWSSSATFTTGTLH